MVYRAKIKKPDCSLDKVLGTKERSVATRSAGSREVHGCCEVEGDDIINSIRDSQTVSAANSYEPRADVKPPSALV